MYISLGVSSEFGGSCWVYNIAIRVQANIVQRITVVCTMFGVGEKVETQTIHQLDILVAGQELYMVGNALFRTYIKGGSLLKVAGKYRCAVASHDISYKSTRTSPTVGIQI